MSNIAELAAKYEQYVIDTRRDFHMHPELSLKEDRTVRRIEEELDKLSIPHVRVGHNNVVGTLEGAKPAGRSPSGPTSTRCRCRRPDAALDCEPGGRCDARLRP